MATEKLKFKLELYATMWDKPPIADIKINEKDLRIDKNLFSQAVATNYFKLMSYKDEYEVSRLFSNEEFINQVNNTFEGDFNINYHLASPIFSKKDPVTNKPIKRSFGPWLLIFFKFLSPLRFLRGTIFDPFGYLEERKIERQLIKEYKSRILAITSKLTSSNYSIAVEIASTPDQIRGFGHIKKKNIEIAKNCELSLMSSFNGHI